MFGTELSLTKFKNLGFIEGMNVGSKRRCNWKSGFKASINMSWLQLIR